MSDDSCAIWVNQDRNWECDWGVIEHGEPRPHLGLVGELMSSSVEYIEQLLQHPGRPCEAARGPEFGMHSATEDSTGRRFAHHDWDGRRWTWELHKAHFVDDGEVVYIGRATSEFGTPVTGA